MLEYHIRKSSNFEYAGSASVLKNSPSGSESDVPASNCDVIPVKNEVFKFLKNFPSILFWLDNPSK